MRQTSIRQYARKQAAPQRMTSGSRSVYMRKVKPAATALPILQRQVQRLTRYVNLTRDTCQYSQNGDETIGNLAGTGIYGLPLMKFSNWNRVFGTTADEESPNEVRIMKTNIDCEIDTVGERSNVDYSLYVISLTKFGAGELLNVATGSLNTPLVNGVHYVIGGTYGQAFLNKKYFNVVKSRRFVTGVSGNVTTEPQGLRKRMYFKFNWNQGKGILHKNPSGDWKAKASPSSGPSNYFIIIFNNDSTVDTSVRFRYNMLHTVDV